jgi:hypothetical protein
MPRREYVTATEKRASVVVNTGEVRQALERAFGVQVADALMGWLFDGMRPREYDPPRVLKPGDPGFRGR